MIYAVIDTNVFVSALLTSNIEAATVKVLKALLQGKIVPLYNKEIFDEYNEVLTRSKFHFSPDLVITILRRLEIWEYPQNVFKVTRYFLI